MSYDASLFQFTDEDYEIAEYVVTDKLIVDNYYAYDVSVLKEDEITTLFEFLLSRDQSNPNEIIDYSVNYEISEQSANNGLIINAVSLNYLEHGIQMDSTMEYEGEGYYNTSIFSIEKSLPILESHHLNHIKDGEVTYEGTTDVDTFERGGQKFYYTNRTFTGEFSNFAYDKYHTIEETEYGFLVIDYKYYRGSFTEFLFNKQEQDPYSYYALGYNSTIYQYQLSLFNSTLNPFYDGTNGIFLKVPIYIQKTTLQ